MIEDCTNRSPASYHARIRKPAEIVGVVLHQTSIGAGVWHPVNPIWYRVRAHYLVKQDGTVLCLHDPLTRMLYGAGQANAWAINVEHAGNYPSDRGQWFKPDKYGKDKLEQYPEQVRASRDLLRVLAERFPTMRQVYAHRHLSPTRSNCCGPDLWREVGQWSIDTLGMVEGTPKYGGQALPDTWRGAPQVGT